jgi:hypothetical protein
VNQVWIIEGHVDSPRNHYARSIAESKQSPAVIQRALTRADFTKPIPEAIHIDTIRATIPILIDEGIVKKGSNPTAALNTLVDTSITKKAVTR